ncbi:hypothetical protein [Formosa algae]|uniref:Uncharacterized protein n=1 Tax=Formosa algae TaxID=225843 RepID=A0A9X0YM32_9FLAO|nr:hypothetical protein [Formosa algae]MBP1839408.1 hypothetical protein [Formosa algae]MDQ0334712.1 hypothetical protein [Formosa algae]OEI81259.1 hypothetical protein AST99_04650 [Formosa algae]
MKDVLINDNLLEEVRTSKNTSKWQDVNCERIVDFGYTHEYLLAKRNVDDIIKKSYTDTFKGMYRTDEWKEYTSHDRPNENTIINHCSFLIEGALHNRVNLWAKIGTLLELKDQHNLNNQYIYLSSLTPYFKRYASNFKSGYNQFLNVIVKPYLLFDNSKEEAAHIIFRFITNNHSNAPVSTVITGFDFENENYNIKYDLTDGLIEGYLYKAWSIIFTQNELFLPIFKKYSSGEVFTNTNKAKVIKDDILKMQNKLIPKVSIEYVYDFFSVLIEPNKKGTFYLDQQKLLIFIESTFINKKPIQQSFNVPFSKDKKDVRSVFRRFYENCFDLEYDKKNLSRKYFDIMNNAFKGFSVDKDLPKWHETNNQILTKDKPKGKL